VLHVDAQGLPSWDEILERGDEEEALERAQRRSRERKLQEEFAEKRVRVVDNFGRSYATGADLDQMHAVRRLACPPTSRAGRARTTGGFTCMQTALRSCCIHIWEYPAIV
jgi:hypothetical protein